MKVGKKEKKNILKRKFFLIILIICHIFNK